MHRTRSTLFLTAVAILLTVAAVWVWAHEGSDALVVRGVIVRESEGLIVLTAEVREALGITTAEVRKGPIEERIAAVGRLTLPWTARAQVPARLGGRVTAVRVQPGQRVRKGEVMAEIRSPEIEELVLELRTALLHQRRTTALIADLKQAGERGAVSGQQLLEVQAEQQELLISADIARRKLAVLGLTNSDEPGDPPPVPILSPLDGVVIEVEVRPGQVVAAGVPLFEVIDPSSLWLRLRLLERDRTRVRPGQTVEFRLDGGTSPLRTEIQRVDHSLEETSREAIAWAELKPSDEVALLPGSNGPAEVVVARRSVPLLDSGAVMTTGAEQYVFVEQTTGQYLRQTVTLGPSSPVGVGIVGGSVYPGDRVVTVGCHELAALLHTHDLRPSPEAVRTHRLRVEPVRRQRVATVVSAFGVLELPPERRAFPTTTLPGTVHRVAVDRSQWVRSGDLLAEVLSPTLQTNQLELLRAHAQLALHEKTLASLRALPERAVSRRRVREVETTVQTGRLRCETLRRNLETAGLTPAELDSLQTEGRLIEYLPVRAPQAGFVTAFRAVLGQTVDVETPLFTLADPTDILVRLDVLPQEATRVRVGQSVRHVLPDGGRLVGKVVRLGLTQATDHRSEGHARTVPIWTTLAAELPDGTRIQSAIIVSESEPVLAVPRTALWREGLHTFVFVRQQDGGFDRREVVCGRSDDRLVEVVEGLREGEWTAVEGVVGLQTGFAALQ